MLQGVPDSNQYDIMGLVRLSSTYRRSINIVLLKLAKQFGCFGDAWAFGFEVWGPGQGSKHVQKGAKDATTYKSVDWMTLI